MRIAVISDLHLGFAWSTERQEDSFRNAREAFSKALAENEDRAVRTALWLRDVRQGAGERQSFRDIFYYLSQHNPKLAKQLIPHVPRLGRWDDLFSFSANIQEDVLDYMARARRMVQNAHE